MFFSTQVVFFPFEDNIFLAPEDYLWEVRATTFLTEIVFCSFEKMKNCLCDRHAVSSLDKNVFFFFFFFFFWN